MTVLIDASGDGLDLDVARLVAACSPAVLTRPGSSCSDRARQAAAVDLTVVVEHRRSWPRVRFDPEREGSRLYGRLVADLLGVGTSAWVGHEVFGRRERSAHDRAVVFVQPQESTPPWRSAATILQALERYLA